MSMTAVGNLVINSVPTQGFKMLSVPTTDVLYASQGQYIFCVIHNKTDM